MSNTIEVTAAIPVAFVTWVTVEVPETSTPEESLAAAVAKADAMTWDELIEDAEFSSTGKNGKLIEGNIWHCEYVPMEAELA